MSAPKVVADGGEDDGEKEEAVEEGDGGVQHQHRALLLLLSVLHLALVLVVVVVGEQTKPIHVGQGECQPRLDKEWHSSRPKENGNGILRKRTNWTDYCKISIILQNKLAKLR